MKELIKSLIKLQVIAYYKNSNNHANSCYKNLDEIKKFNRYDICVRKDCDHIDFCMEINKIMNELDNIDKKEYNIDINWLNKINNKMEETIMKECEHNRVRDIVSNEKYQCMDCNKIIEKPKECEHDWSLENNINGTVKIKTYRCIKCGVAKYEYEK